MRPDMSAADPTRGSRASNAVGKPIGWGKRTVSSLPLSMPKETTTTTTTTTSVSKAAVVVPIDLGAPDTLGRGFSEPLVALSLDEAAHLMTLAGDDPIAADLARLIERGQRIGARLQAQQGRADDE